MSRFKMELPKNTKIAVFVTITPAYFSIYMFVSMCLLSTMVLVLTDEH